MTEDHHHYKQRLETAVANIQNSDKVREENKELVVEFGNWLALRSISYGRQYRYISSLKQIIEHNDFRLDNLKEDEESKKKIHAILGQVERSEYYSKEYSLKTKMEYKSAIKRLLEFQDLTSNPEESPLLPKGFKAYVPEKDKERTDPKDLPTPSDVAKLARKMEADSIGLTSFNLISILTG